jgi:hypothetical protein
MALVTVPLPPGIEFPSEERIKTFLENQGITSYQGSIIAGDGTITIDLADLQEAVALEAAVAAFQNQPTQRELIEEQLINDAKGLIIAIKNKGPANWTSQDKIVLALALAVNDLQGVGG